MDLVQHFAPSLLLAHVICPLFVGLLLTSGHIKSNRIAQQIATGVNLLLAALSILLLVSLFQGAALERSLPGATSEIRFSWPPSNDGASPPLMGRVTWAIVPENAPFLCLLPWLSLTVQLFTTTAESGFRRTGMNLMLLGTLGLFTVSTDVGSLLSGAFFSVLLVSLLVARHGTPLKRSAASLFLIIQMTGLMLFAAGLAIFVANAGAIRSAPHGLPGNGSTTLPELAAIIQSAVHQHPAAEQLWGEYRTLPSWLVLCGIVIMGAAFPMQVWVSEVSDSAALGERLWLLGWVKAALLVGLRWLSLLDPEALRSFGMWGLAISIAGALFASSLLLAQAYLPRLQSSGLLWTQQVALISAFAATRDLDQWLIPLLISHMAALVLFIITLTMISERYFSPELTSFQGLSARADWLTPVLATCMLTLTLSPLGLGLLHAWLATATLLGSETWWGALLRLIYLMANLLALAGLARITQQLCTGTFRSPEMAPGLRERACLPEPTATLQLSRVQTMLMFGWGTTAIVAAFALQSIRLFSR